MWGARHSSRDYRSAISGTRWSFYKILYVCEFIFSLFCVCIYLLCGKIFGEAKSSIGFELTRDRVFDVARITAFMFYQKKIPFTMLEQNNMLLLLMAMWASCRNQ
jgi:hypothetical protein